MRVHCRPFLFFQIVFFYFTARYPGRCNSNTVLKALVTPPGNFVLPKRARIGCINQFFVEFPGGLTGCYKNLGVFSKIFQMAANASRVQLSKTSRNRFHDLSWAERF
jgi:hypothetical protein